MNLVFSLLSIIGSPSFAAGVSPDFVGLALPDGTSDFVVARFGLSNETFSPINATDPLQCPEQQCRFAFGRGSGISKSGILGVVNFGDLFPAMCSLVEVDVGKGVVVNSFKNVGYLYGLSRAGLGCKYIALNVVQSVETPPSLVCINTDSTSNETQLETIHTFGSDVEIMTSGTDGSHFFDSVTGSYTVTLASKNASVVATANLVSNTTTTNIFDAHNVPWQQVGQYSCHVNPVVDIIGPDGNGGILAVVAKACSIESNAAGEAVCRRLDLWIGVLQHGSLHQTATPPPKFLFPLPDMKAACQFSSKIGGGLGFAFPDPSSPKTSAFAVLFHSADVHPEHDQLQMVQLDIKGRKVVATWPWDSSATAFLPYSLEPVQP